MKFKAVFSAYLTMWGWEDGFVHFVVVLLLGL
jgi:hypothetical protein